MAKLFALKEKCMALTLSGTRCKHDGTLRHAVGSTRYAICQQHADMLAQGKNIQFGAHITAENVKESINQAQLPGLDTNVEMARDVLRNTEGGYDCELFYVRGLEPGKVLVLHKEVIHIHHWAKSILIKEAVDRMPNIEGRITGIMVRSGNMKAVWNRKPQGWVERPIPTNLTMVTINNEENK